VLKVVQLSKVNFFFRNAIHIDILSDILSDPIDGDARCYEEEQICEQTNGWESVNSSDLFQENNL